MEIHNGTYCVYIHINKINGKMYIGQTVNGEHPKRRWQNGLGYQTQKYFWRAIKKYGWGNFEHEVVVNNLTKEEADNFEKLLIKKLNTTDKYFGYNITLGGGGSLGKHPTDEQIQKQKNSMRKYYEDELYIQRMRDVANKRAVWQFSPTGKFLNSYISSKEAERQTGVSSGGICACALRKVPSADEYIWTYENDTEDIPQRVNEYNNKKIRKEPIVQLTLDGDFIKEWKGAAEAGRELGINYKNINSVCRHKRRNAGGFNWMYLSDYYNYLENNIELIAV